MRYQIWNKTDSIMTPVGNEYSASEWVAKYKWAGKPGVKAVITQGTINGGVMMEFETFKEHYIRQGCEITPEMSDDDVLRAVEAWEERVIEEPITVEERMASLEEYKAMLELDGFQVPEEIVEKNFERGLWTETMLDKAVEMGSLKSAKKTQLMGSVGGGVVPGVKI